jgi:selenocysteine lyase/cysteine desulfurase
LLSPAIKEAGCAFGARANELQKMNCADARSCFPGVQGRAFLDAACVSLMPVQADEALRRLGQDLLHCPARDASSHHIALDATADWPRREIAKLIHAPMEDIALVESTTHALQVVAAAVPLGAGDKILVGETEFLGLAVPWIGKRERQGYGIEIVPHHQGRILVEDFARRIDASTKMILLSSVQWNNGFRADLAAFSELAVHHDTVLVIDAIQHLGAVRLDVKATPVDFLVCGGHKWLNAPAGRGFLYANTRRRWAAPARGYLHIQQPPEGWAEYFATPDIPAIRDYHFVEDARQFELGGTANYPGNVVLGASVGLLNEVGPAAIEAHVFSLGDPLMDGLNRLGATVVSPSEPLARSGILTFTLGHGPDRDRKCLHYLWDQAVVISHRYTAGVGGLRVSLHLYNNHDDVDRLIYAVRQFQE